MSCSEDGSAAAPAQPGEGQAAGLGPPGAVGADEPKPPQVAPALLQRRNSRRTSTMGRRGSHLSGAMSFGSSSDCSGEPAFELLHEWRADNKQLSRRRSNCFGSLGTATSTEEAAEPCSRPELRLQRAMLQPSSLTHLVWSCCGLVLILFDVVSIPLEFFEPEETAFMSCMWWIIRLFWTMDIARAFLTGRMGSNGELEMRFKKVASLYLSSWRLPVDLLTVACDWVLLLMPGTSGATLTGLWLTRTVRIVRLLRVSKVSEIEGYCTEFIQTESGALIVHMTKMMLVLVVAAHVIACIWYKVGMREGDSESAGWVFHYRVLDASLEDRYTWAMYWSLSQFTGENIFAPHNSAERSFAVFVLLVAFLLSALFVSSITTSMTRLTIVAGKQPLQIVALRRFLFDKGISTSLFVRMQRNAQQALQEKKKAAPELLALISEPLLIEFHFELYSPALLEHPFLLYYHEVNPACIRKICHAAVSTLLLLKGDILFRDNETPAPARMLYVPEAGQLQYHVYGARPQSLSGNLWLCEPVLWTTWVHCGTLVAEASCKVLALDAERFRKVMSSIPTRDAGKYAAAFVRQLNRVDQPTDVWAPDYDEVLFTALPTAVHLVKSRSPRRPSTASQQIRAQVTRLGSSSFSLSSAPQLRPECTAAGAAEKGGH
mmetsp:Transcript_86787/g.210493  ORF Transcript_86787/g.210493 Transcript_86787/m.210493 type:complete len:660 (-) Transcript_86787:85-2064(-)